MNFKSLMKKVSIVLVCLMMFSFCSPKVAKAAGEGEDGIGGKLLNPVMSLVVSLGDGIMSLIQRVVAGIENTFTEVSTVEQNQAWYEKTWNWIKDKWGYIAGATLIIVGVAIAAFTGGLGSGATVILAKIGAGLIFAAAASGAAACVVYQYDTNLKSGQLPDKLVLPTYSITVKNIFSNQIPLLDVDFFNPSDNKTIKYVDNDGNTQTAELFSTAGKLQKTISKWYKRLRDIAVVALLSILVYIGIRILISSTSNDKAKYKQMIVDWIVALCLLFTMQYIMSFSNILADKIIELASSINTNTYDTNEIKSKVNANPEKIQEGFETFTISDETTVNNIYKLFVETWAEENGKEESAAPMYKFFINDDSGKRTFVWPAEDEMAQVRMRMQILYNGGQTWESIGYKIIYAVLVVFTCTFLFTYVRRVLYMAFLTMIAPLVAMTYPLDKINDGKAQAFDKWIKEYIFNLLIQPMHLVLYTVLIGSAMDLASTNIIYVVCALGFMIPAEKLLRSFFGFEKAHTPGLLAGPAGAAMMMSGMNKLLGRGPKGGRDNYGKGGNSNSEKDDDKVKTHKSFDTDEAFGGKALSDKNDNSKQEEDSSISLDENGEEDSRVNLDENSEEEKTDLQKMSDADYEDNWLGADNNEIQTLEANARDAYGDGEGMKYTDEEMEGILRDSGYSDEEIAEYMKDYNKDDSNDNLDENIQQESQPDTNAANKDNEEDQNYKSKGSIKKAITRAGRMYSDGMGNKIANKVNNAHLGRRAIRIAGGAALGAAAGTVGVVAGIASGDPSKAFQYTTAGIAAGYKAGSGVGNKIANIPKSLSVEGVGKKFKEEYYGKKVYQDKQIEKATKEKQHDLELKYKLEDEYGKEIAKKYMKNFIPEVTKYGIDDNKTIAAMIEMQEKKGYTEKETIAAALISERDLDGRDYNTRSGKTKKEFSDTIRKRGEERSLKGDNLNNFVNKQIEAVKDLDNIRYK